MDDKVNLILERYKRNRRFLVSILQDIQGEYYYLPKDVLKEVSLVLDVPLSQIYGVATFFKAFSLVPRGRHLVNVCLGTACHVRGGPRILEKAQNIMGICAGHTTSDMRYTLERVNCLGCCALGPVMTVDGEAFGKLAVKDVESILSTYE